MLLSVGRGPCWDTWDSPPDRQSSTEPPGHRDLGILKLFPVPTGTRWDQAQPSPFPRSGWIQLGVHAPVEGAGGMAGSPCTVSWRWTRCALAGNPQATRISLREQGQRCSCCQHSWAEPCWGLAHRSLLLMKDLTSRSLELTHSLLSSRNPFSLSLYRPVGKKKPSGNALR